MSQEAADSQVVGSNGAECTGTTMSHRNTALHGSQPIASHTDLSRLSKEEFSGIRRQDGEFSEMMCDDSFVPHPLHTMAFTVRAHGEVDTPAGKQQGEGTNEHTESKTHKAKGSILGAGVIAQHIDALFATNPNSIPDIHMVPSAPVGMTPEHRARSHPLAQPCMA